MRNDVSRNNDNGSNACVKCFRNGTGGCQEAVVQCATQIYIAQMNKNEERAE